MTVSDKMVTTKSVVNSETDSKGALSVIGLGVDEDKTVKTTISSSNVAQNSNTTNITNKISFNGNGSEIYTTEVYYDVVYGAFACRVVPPSGATMIKGKITSLKKSISNQIITITNGTKTYVSQTDQKGNFNFNIVKNDKGFMKVITGEKSTNIRFIGKPVKGVKIKID
jgi:hypothetical protein